MIESSSDCDGSVGLAEQVWWLYHGSNGILITSCIKHTFSLLKDLDEMLKYLLLYPPLDLRTPDMQFFIVCSGGWCFEDCFDAGNPLNVYTLCATFWSWVLPGTYLGLSCSGADKIGAGCLEFCGMQRGLAPLRAAGFRAFGFGIFGARVGESSVSLGESWVQNLYLGFPS